MHQNERNKRDENDFERIKTRKHRTSGLKTETKKLLHNVISRKESAALLSVTVPQHDSQDILLSSKSNQRVGEYLIAPWQRLFPT